MFARTLAVAAIGLVPLGAPAWGQDLARFDPSQGVGGYIGTVEALQRPVLLLWSPRTGIIGTVESLSVLEDGARERVVTVYTGRVEERRAGLQRRFAVSELTVNDRQWSPRNPLVVVESWCSPTGGDVTDLDIAFPGFEELGIPPPAPGTPQFAMWRDMFAADLAFSTSPVRMGDPVFDQASYHDLLEQQVGGLLGNPEAVIEENTFAAIARGLTTIDGRTHLVAELSGRIVARDGANVLTMEGSGYGLVDLASGLVTGISRTVVTAGVGERRVRRTVYVDVRLLQ